jgi:hypothetical protein
MRPMRYLVAAAVIGLLGVGPMTQSALAFEETTVGGGAASAPAAPVLELPKELPKGMPKETGEPGKGINLKITPDMELTPPGTEIRVPGLGKVGVLPKLDFGLELLYGANEPKGTFEDQSNPDDVQLRGTIKHRF